MTKHPGRSPAQRHALNEIGIGNYSPIMAKSTRDALLRRGLIEEISPKVLSGPLPVTIRQFQMPIPVHIQWCKAMASEADDEHENNS